MSLEAPSAVTSSARTETARKLGRFRIDRVLGQGSSSTVLAAWDPRHERSVAIKTIVGDAPLAAFEALKHEFRTASRLHHPNLLRFLELGHDGDVPLLVMERVDGDDFVTFCRPGGALDRDRLRHTLRQLADALDALHHAGLVHRDLKPSNTLVTTSGRLVLLDFGLAHPCDAQFDVWGEDLSLRGTAAYLAPERTVGAACGPASDWYAVGVMMHEALVGRLPTTRGANALGLFARQVVVPDGSFPDDVPSSFRALCRALLHPRPAARADSAACRQLVDPELRPSSPSTQPPMAAHFVGRDAEMAAIVESLQRTRRARASMLILRGPSGIGKTSVLRYLPERVARNTLVLEGRCHEQESIPYKGLDAVLDKLVRYLWALTPSERALLLPNPSSLLLDVFPCFTRIPELASAKPIITDADAQQRRLAAFAQIHQILCAISAKRPVLVVIDDWQWSDTDSRFVVETLLAPPATLGLAFVLALRSGVGEAPWERDWVRNVQRLGVVVETRTLEPLSAGSSVVLAGLLRPEDVRREDRAADIAQASQGNPYFLEMLARMPASAIAARPSLDDAIAEVLAPLGGTAHGVLCTLAVAGHPLDEEILCRVAACDSEIIDRLVGRKLVRLTSGARIDVYHDAVRQCVLGRLDANAAIDVRRSLVEAMAASSGTKDHEAIARHLHVCGDLDRAAAHALLAADVAFATLAMDRAEVALRLALDCGHPDVVGLELRRAEALAGGGRCVEAAELLVAFAMRSGKSDEVLAQAAQHFMHGGRVDDGVRTLEPVLASLQLAHPNPDARTLGRALLDVAALLRRRSRSVQSASPRAEVDRQRMVVCLAAGKGLAPSDPLRSAAYVLTASRHAIALGDANGTAQCLAYFGLTLSYSGFGPAIRWGERLLEEADAIAADRQDAHGRAWVKAVRAVTAVGRCRWRAGLTELDEACYELAENTAGTHFEQAAARTTALLALLELGEIEEMAMRARRLSHEASSTGDVFTWVEATLYVALASLAEDRPHVALRALDEVLSTWTQSSFLFQHWLLARHRAWILLYLGEPECAAEVMHEAARRARTAGLFGVHIIRVESHRLLGVAALQSGALGEARAAARALLKETDTWAGAWAILIDEGGRALQHGRAPDSTRIETACRRLEVCDQKWIADCVRRQFAGDEDRATFDHTLRLRGVTEPARWGAIFALARMHA